MKWIKAVGIYYKNEIETIKKNEGHPLSPVFEAITNSWEAIAEKYHSVMHNGIINILFYFDEQLPIEGSIKCFNLNRIEVFDNGNGLTTEGYERLKTLRDDRKMFNNKGTGRIQFIHFFNETKFESYALLEPQKYKHTIVTLSKSHEFIEQNAIMREELSENTNSQKEFSTKVTFKNPLDEKDLSFYNNITAESLKEQIINHFLLKLCKNKESLPKITIKTITINGEEKSEEILKDDIPSPSCSTEMVINYKKLDLGGQIQIDGDTANFELKSFIIPSKKLKQNAIYLVSKGETTKNICLYDLKSDDIIDDHRYLFLISGDYIDKIDSDNRGELILISEKDLKNQVENGQGLLFEEKVILSDDIENQANSKIRELHSEIRKKVEERDNNVDTLQRLFFLNPKIVSSIKTKLKIDDTDETILKKIYSAECEAKAKSDAILKERIEKINLLPTEADYRTELDKETKLLVENISTQNRLSLAQYVAHRKIVLTLFEKILNKDLKCLQNEDRINEKILHNLIFQQHSDNTNDSDLWLINEDFIYFSGISEAEFKDIRYNDQKIFDKDFSEKEKEYLCSRGEKRLSKRPDILLFPEEGKCIIIEFKAPDVNASEHINQIQFYANLLLNYTRDQLGLTRFYGCLIGENLEDRDIRGYASNFVYAPNFKYWFKTDSVTGFDGKPNGDLYMEIIEYSTLLKRAKERNQVFIKKLGLPY